MSQQPYEVGAAIIPILQMCKLKQRVLKVDLGFKLNQSDSGVHAKLQYSVLLLEKNKHSNKTYELVVIRQ